MSLRAIQGLSANPVRSFLDPMSVPAREGRLGYLAREFVQCTLPHRDPKGVLSYKRVDGNLTLSITAHPEIGLPYGTIPRLLMLWVTSEAVRTQSRRLDMGKSLSQFLREVGLNPGTGRGKRGDAKRLECQMKRLFRSRISFEYSRQTIEGKREGWLDMAVASKGCLWWDVGTPEAITFSKSWIELSEDFYTAIVANAVPINLAMAGQLKRSPLALDLFVWVAYRLYRIKVGQQVTISLDDLCEQFGTEYERVDNFRVALIGAIAKVQSIWPEAPIELTSRGLRLTGVPSHQLPVQRETSSFAVSTVRRSPFDLTAKELLKADKHAYGWDVRALRQEWEKWCRSLSIVPNRPPSHFTSFVKEHCKRNGKAL